MIAGDSDTLKILRHSSNHIGDELLTYRRNDLRLCKELAMLCDYAEVPNIFAV